MSDPVRLLEGSNADAAALLEAWAGERPGGHVRERALALASGIGATALAGAAGSAAGANSVATTAGKLALGKWLAFGAIGGAIAAAAAASAGLLSASSAANRVDLGGEQARSPSSAPAASAAVALVPSVRVLIPDDLPAAVGASAAPSSSPSVAPPGASEAPVAPVVSVARMTRTVSPPQGLPGDPLDAAVLPPASGHDLASAGAGSSAPSVASELAAIDHARAAVRRGDGAGALALLDAFDAEFPNSSLADEALVVRVEALVRAGQKARAAAVAAAFVERKPASPYAARLRTMAEPPPLAAPVDVGVDPKRGTTRSNP